jgi:hypothetical protein
MKFDRYAFGSIRIDGSEYCKDLVIDRGKIRRRKKGASRKYRASLGHTPLSLDERIPWRCKRLVVGTGAQGVLPIMPDVRREAARRHVELIALPTDEAVKLLSADRRRRTNAILHLTC